MKRAESLELSSLGQSDRRERRPRFIKKTLGKYPSPEGEVARSDGGGSILQASALGRCPEAIMPRCGMHGCRTCDP